jgi:hypothetical protein
MLIHLIQCVPILNLFIHAVFMICIDRIAVENDIYISRRISIYTVDQAQEKMYLSQGEIDTFFANRRCHLKIKVKVFAIFDLQTEGAFTC